VTLFPSTVPSTLHSSCHIASHLHTPSCHRTLP
jgi:hypothetical protein